MHISDYHRLIAVLRMESDVLSLESVTGHGPAMSLWKSEVLPITLYRHISLHVSSVLSRLVFMVSTSEEVSRYCGRPYQDWTDAQGLKALCSSTELMVYVLAILSQIVWTFNIPLLILLFATARLPPYGMAFFEAGSAIPLVKPVWWAWQGSNLQPPDYWSR